MEDAKILDLYFARDEDAIRETDTAYGKRLHTLAKNILQNREDAEESVNDTYAEVWKSIPPRRPKYFFAFLASICRHLSLNRVDWKQAAKRRAAPSADFYGWRDHFAYAVMKDGTKIQLLERTNCEPIDLAQVDYVLLAGGTKLPVPQTQ